MFRKKPAAPENATETDKKKDKPWDESFRTIIYAVLLAVVFRSLLFEPFHIPSGSMKNTLLVGDYLFVSKFSYGYSRYSFPYGLELFEGRIMESKPERGDIVVFRLPANPKIDYIKRLIGLPGDKVQVIDGALYLNGKEVKRELVDAFDYDVQDDGQLRPVKQYRETLPGGKSYLVLDSTEFNEVDNTPIYTVPDDHYFMLGDNRDNSRDSRYVNEVGFVPAENLIGRAEMILFSVGGDTSFWQVWKWPFAIRDDRFFTMLD